METTAGAVALFHSSRGPAPVPASGVRKNFVEAHAPELTALGLWREPRQLVGPGPRGLSRPLCRAALALQLAGPLEEASEVRDPEKQAEGVLPEGLRGGIGGGCFVAAISAAPCLVRAVQAGGNSGA